jgi:hypothetical protein
MNLDDFVQSIPNSENALRDEFAHLVDVWKRSAESLENLDCLVTKWHGNVWFQKTEDSDIFLQNWRNFKTEAIDGINGMTVNERLYFFGMFELWDESNEEFHAVLRTKLKAHA